MSVIEQKKKSINVKLALLGDCLTGKTQIMNALINDNNSNSLMNFNENYNVYFYLILLSQ